MTIGAGIFLIAVGAILKFATNFHVQEVSIDTIGIILMVAGAIGLLWALMMTNRRTAVGTTVVEERPVRRVYEDPV